MRKFQVESMVSRAKLAENASIAPAYIAMIELGKKFPSDEVLERIAKALKIEPTDLFSQFCFQIEDVRIFQKSITDSIEQAVKTQISAFNLKTKSKK